MMAEQVDSGDPVGQWFGLAETCTRSGMEFWSGMADIWLKPAEPVKPDPAPMLPDWFGWAAPAPVHAADTVTVETMFAPWLAPWQAIGALQAPRQYQPGTEWMALWLPSAAPANPFQAWADAWAEGASRAMMPQHLAALTDTLRDPRAGVPFVSYRSEGGHAVAQIAHTSTRSAMAMVPAMMAFSDMMMSFVGANRAA